ncbi:Zinc finger protein ZAT9, partial [Mucuna pruriens]
MEKHKCKLCLRSFANGRALGGHMRSHMMNLPVPPKANEYAPVQLSFEAESSPSQSSSSFYTLRENPKKSFRVADPEFSFAADTGSVILQDRESETESSKKPTRRRSKRAWQLGCSPKKMKLNKSESASSASDTSEENVAFSLMMLSRDKWRKDKHYETEQQQHKHYETEQHQQHQFDDDDEDDVVEVEEEEDSYASEEPKFPKKNNKVRGKYKCETCDKVFRSYQALGGHRASHKKVVIKLNCENEGELELEHAVVAEKKIHECPVCSRVFASGQALGGHKRTHVIGSATTTTAIATLTDSVRTSATASVRISTRVGNSFIDLNLPAPMDENEDGSQFENSAVSDAEFEVDQPTYFIDRKVSSTSDTGIVHFRKKNMFGQLVVNPLYHPSRDT